MNQMISVIIRCGRAYVVVYGQTDDGLNVAVEPVFQGELIIDDLVNSFEHALAFDTSSVPLPQTDEEWRAFHKKHPILTATGAKNDAKLAKTSAAYTIDWYGDEVTLVLHELDKKGRFADGLGRHITFPGDTPLRTLAEAILEDVRKLPELGYVDVTQPK